MRLIDADSLILNMNNGIQGTARNYLKFFQMAVNDEPTAFEFDKIVEQIEKLEEECADPLQEYNPEYFIDKAIEIVESGVVK